MTYQPLYARVSDNQGYYRGTSCVRGRVDNISMWLNSWFGSVLKVNASLIDGKEVIPRPDLRTIKKEHREQALKEYEQEVSKENKVIVDIDIPAKKEFIIKINGIELSYDRLKLMEQMKLKRMDMQIEAIKKLTEKDNKVLQVAQAIIQV